MNKIINSLVAVSCFILPLLTSCGADDTYSEVVEQQAATKAVTSPEEGITPAAVTDDFQYPNATTIYPDKFSLINFQCSSRYLNYDIVYHAVNRDYVYYALYTMILFKGTYDNSLFSNLGWIEKNGTSVPPNMPYEYGRTCYHFHSVDNGGGTARVVQGGQRYHTGSFDLVNRSIDEIEYLLVYIWDQTGKYYELYDFPTSLIE